jgi:ABC-type proline/glycine betaine transport system permease subunit
MKAPSALGLAIEEAIEHDPRFKRDREPVQYAAFFRTLSGTPFLTERVTINHINLWVPDLDVAKATAEALGLSVMRSVPNLTSSKYGRLSTLKTVPELASQPLLIPVQAAHHNEMMSPAVTE